MKIVGCASAFPRHYYPQEVLSEALKQHWGDRLPNPGMVDRLHRNVGVSGRYLVMPLDEYAGITRWGQANDIWIKKAEELGQMAICRALAGAGFAARDIDALFFTSITGVASPSIDARLINRMHLSSTIRRTPIFGLGCVGGAAGISQAADYVRAYPDHVAVLFSVEICSLTLQRDDLSIANLIASGLFGDGAAAVVIAADESDAPGPEIVDTRSVFYPDTENVMGWDISESGFKIVLSARVPDMVRKHLREDLDAFLVSHDLTRRDIGGWIFHTGGPKVLEAVEDALALHNGELEISWDALRRTGNLSSASVLVVLEEVMKRRRPEPGTWSILAAMGPGFCSEMVLLRW